MRLWHNIRAIARSHIGELRPTNEDRILNCVEDRLWAVADGMGGHSMGDVAAEIVINSLSEIAAKGQIVSRTSIVEALNRANAHVIALEDKLKARIGSTVAGLHIYDDEALIFWAGDSRIYRRRNGSVVLLTHDHRAVQEMIDAGLIDASQARAHPKAAVITRAIGAAKTFSPALRVEQIMAGDSYLICSDGLSDMVNIDEITNSMAHDDSTAADCLIHAALAAGGSDNVSVIVISVDLNATPHSDAVSQRITKTICY